MLPIAVLYDRADGQRFLAERPAARAICALTPAVEMGVQHAGIAVVGGRSNYGDDAQARTLTLRERLRQEWRQALRPEVSSNATIWFVLDLALVTLIHGYDRLRCVVGTEGP